MLLLCALVLAAQPAIVATTDDTRDTLMVMTPGVADDAALRDKLAAALTREAAKEPRVRVFSSSDITQLADLAAQQQLAACDSDACITEIGDAMGARYVLFSTLQQFDSLVLELRLLDAHTGDIVSRAATSAHSPEQLFDTVDDATRELLRAPFPPPPLYTRPAVIAGVAGLGVGVVGAAVGGYGAFHFDGVARDAASSGADKAQAYAVGPLCVAGAVVGGGVALLGVVLVAAGAW